MAVEYAVAYVNQDQSLECGACDKFNIVGIRLMERTGKQARPKGFICLPCVVRMWNAPTPGVLEPSADERDAGFPIIDMEGKHD